MGKLMLAFAAGLMVTCLALFLFRGPEPTSDRGVTEPVPAGRVPEYTALSDNELERSDNELQPVNPGAPAETRTAELLPEKEAPDSTFGNEQRALEPPPEIPIWLPREFEWLASEPAFLSLQRQAIDPTWSIRTEAQINSYFAERPEMYTRFGGPTVHCRTTACMVLIVAHGISESALVQDFARSLASDYQEQAWAKEFEITTSDTHSEEDVTTLVWGLWRKD